MNSYRISSIKDTELAACLETIHRAFGINCERFGFTKENYPSCAAFMTLEELQREKENGTHIYGAWVEDKLVGSVQIKKDANRVYTFKRFAVLPEYQHGGIGKALVAHCIDRATTYGGVAIRLLMIHENEKLRRFYESLGFHLVNTYRDDDHPFLCGIYQIDL